MASLIAAKTRSNFAALVLLAALGIGGGVMSACGASEMAPPASEPAADTYSDAAFARVLENVDDQGLVDYAALKAEPEYLEAYSAAVANLDPATYEGWDEEPQIAFWSNAYNALTLVAIIENYPIERSAAAGETMHPRGIRWIPGVWDELTFTVMGREMTLNDIEHQVLRVEYDEPRIHAALVCAAISCPPLRNEPFTAERLDEQFDDQTRRFLARPENFRIDRQTGKIYVSKILEWYGGDFVFSFEPEEGFAGHSEAERSFLSFISAYLGEEDREYLKTGSYDVEYSGYDWSLNDQAGGAG